MQLRPVFLLVALAILPARPCPAEDPVTQKILASLDALLPPLVGVEPVTAEKEWKQLVLRSGKRQVLRYQAERGDTPSHLKKPYPQGGIRLRYEGFEEEFPRPDIKPVYLRGGYIQALYSPAGRRITDDYPANHLHHHGVWMPWTKTEFEGRKPDFWNMGEGTGRVEFVSLDKVWQKNNRAGFTARHRFMDLTVDPPKTALLETWEITVTAHSYKTTVDFTSTQTCAGDAPLKLPKYHYGGFGFRGHPSWDGAKNNVFLTSTGLTGRDQVNASRADWCYTGRFHPVDPSGHIIPTISAHRPPVGVYIMCHPENFRAPQPIRAHPTEPFFCFAPQQLGDMEIIPGKPYASRYRLVIVDAPPSAEFGAAEWKAWTRR